MDLTVCWASCIVSVPTSKTQPCYNKLLRMVVPLQNNTTEYFYSNNTHTHTHTLRWPATRTRHLAFTVYISMAPTVHLMRLASIAHNSVHLMRLASIAHNSVHLMRLASIAHN